ncbi:MAG: hypothetical protein J7623_24080 [Chitinophaga sp.]|uniref:hypothetical protein n=1 Tax=Chitinophaga sp. TaxID=1869181 RepID=UPI001B2D0AE3|nr:hypothetical protein [Chitinophaga sp.]MBO9731741.1 hypothetical protein [Chitinophaga sp.]
MDNPVQTEIENYIAASRIRTTRRRIRDARTQFEKQLLSLHRKEKALWDTWSKRGYVPLEPPVMKGYKRFFVLRDDVAKGRNATFYEELLKKINTYEYSHRKDFKVKKRSHGRKKLVVREQQLLQPDVDHFAKLKLTEKEAACFEERYFFYKNGLVPQKRMVFRESWRFVLRVRPNMITKTRAMMPELLSQIDQLRNYLQAHFLEKKIRKLTDGKVYRWYGWLTAEKGKYIKKRTLQQMLQEEWYDKI